MVKPPARAMCGWLSHHCLHTQMIHRLDDLMNYCHLRELNIKDFLVAAGFHQVTTTVMLLLVDFSSHHWLHVLQFVIDMRRTFPTPHNCLVGGLGYMTQSDVERFDKAVSACMPPAPVPLHTQSPHMPPSCTRSLPV